MTSKETLLWLLHGAVRGFSTPCVDCGESSLQHQASLMQCSHLLIAPFGIGIFPVGGEKDTVLSEKVFDRPDHLILFRKYVSRQAAAKGRAVLERVGLCMHTIDTCFSSHPLNEEQAVQERLTRWSYGPSYKLSTWKVFLDAMEHAQIAQEHVHGQKNELGLLAASSTPHSSSSLEHVINTTDVIKALRTQLDAHWRIFGIYLRVEPAIMDGIQMDHRYGGDCMLQLVKNGWVMRTELVTSLTHGRQWCRQ